jgi:hypothetical protein
VFIVDGAGANFDQSGSWVLGGVLPVAVSTDNKGVGYAGKECPEFVAFMGKARIGMVVVFPPFIRADNR